ncbi:hypothetical protein F4818DRAFT_437822 [Hypoxylon cercidicola]|nr:hypothetical protein F4818DRAFT_437822 [Hypoxylon cercidicola]
MEPVPKHVADTVMFVKKGLQNEKYIKITTSNLDFYSGQPSNHDEIFIKPFPLSQMLQRMEHSRPWDNPGGCASILPIDDHLDNCGKARALWNVFRSHLRLNQDENGPGVIQGTGWEIVLVNEDDTLFQLTTLSP